jgi:hypothetical protein
MGNINVTKFSERKDMLCCWNTSETETPAWHPIGSGVETSDIALELETNTIVDILGETTTTMGKPKLTQEFDGLFIKGSDPISQKLYNLWLAEDWGNLSGMDFLVIYGFAGTKDSEMDAVRYPSSAIVFSQLGGETFNTFTFTVTFGGTKVTGTAAIASGVITFTETSNRAKVVGH